MAESGQYEFPTDPALKFRRQIAAQLMGNAFEIKPLQHWTQGAAQIAQALVGGYMGGRAEREETARDKDRAELFVKSLAPNAVPPTPTPRFSDAAPSSVAERLAGVSDRPQPASVRTNNPGAMWPGQSSQKYGSTTHENLRDGNKIAVFDNPVSGAAAGFDLLTRRYAGMPFASAMREWSGQNISPGNLASISQATGIAPGEALTPELIAGPKGQALMREMARIEAGRAGTLNPSEIAAAQTKVFGDEQGATGGLGADKPAPVPAVSPQSSQGMPELPPQLRATITNLARSPKGLEQAQKLYFDWLTKAITKQDEPTAEMRNFESYKRDQAARGEPALSFDQWDLTRRKAQATQVQISQEGEKEQSKLLGKNLAETQIAIQTAADRAYSKLGTITIMRQAMADPNFYSGLGGEGIVRLLKQGIVALGGDPNSAASLEVFRSQANKSVMDSLGGSLGTGFSNADRDFVVSIAPNLSNTPQGNAALLDLSERVERRNVAIADLMDNYIAANGKLDQGFRTQLRKWANENPLFKEDERSALIGQFSKKEAEKGREEQGRVRRYVPGKGFVEQ